ncbi:MAG: hypothetical protein H7A41_07915 [Chlamydiales bacterium]|nr:hypothetical protein [Chlamydiales bacterium]
MQEHPFHLQELFKKEPKVTLTDQEIADALGISMECAIKYRKQDVERGFIFVDESLLTYYLSPIGFERVQDLRIRYYRIFS